MVTHESYIAIMIVFNFLLKLWLSYFVVWMLFCVSLLFLFFGFLATLFTCWFLFLFF